MCVGDETDVHGNRTELERGKERQKGVRKESEGRAIYGVGESHFVNVARVLMLPLSASLNGNLQLQISLVKLMNQQRNLVVKIENQTAAPRRRISSSVAPQTKSQSGVWSLECGVRHVPSAVSMSEGIEDAQCGIHSTDA